jgi:hypothetical protein
LHIMAKSFVLALLTFFVFTSGLCFGQGGVSGKPPDITLSPADQLILKSIDKLNDRMDEMGRELNGRMDEMGRELNGRIDNLWVTMLGGFLGVMAFIGALVFWDRRTFLSRAREGLRMDMAQETNKVDGLLAAMKKLGEQFPQVREALRSFGLM